jgi:hypothetical protein
MARIKRAMVLLALGGATFVFFGFGNPSCVRSSNLVDFYQDVGGASINAFADSTANIIGSDFDAIVIEPTQGFFTSAWDNWVAQQFPLDVEPITGNVLRQ